MLLKNELKIIESYIEESHRSNDKVSSKAVAWHLDHTLKVIIRVCDMLQSSDPSSYVWELNFSRIFIFSIGYIPRGIGRAPKQVLPPEKISKDDLYKQLNVAQERLNNTSNLAPKNNFKHPYFGVLNLKQTHKFLRLHTNHHIKICADIIN